METPTGGRGLNGDGRGLPRRRLLGAGAALVALVLLPTCTEPFPSDVEEGPFTVTIEPVLWPDTVVLAGAGDYSVRVEDGQGRILVEPPVAWRVPPELEFRGEGRSDPAGPEATFVGSQLGTGQLEAYIPADGLFEAAQHQAPVTTALAGVALVSAPDTMLTALADTVVIRARGFDFGGVDVAGLELEWDTAGLRVLEPVTVARDTARLAALATGVDTVSVGFAPCAASCDPVALAAGTCQESCSVDVVVAVAQAVNTVSVTTPSDTLLARDTVRAVAAGRDRNGYDALDAVYAWSSSDDLVVTVDTAGLITARGTGVAFVVAEAASGVRDSVRVEVLPSGELVVQVTDAPSDHYAAVRLYVAGAYVLDPLVSHGRRYLETQARSYELLSLSGGTTDTVGVVQAPGASYGTVWLLLDSAVVELASGFTFADGTTRRKLDPPAGAADSLAAIVEGGADVAGGDTTTVVIDFDVDRNFPLTSTPGAGGVIDGVAWRAQARSVVRSRAASIGGTLSAADTVSVENRRLRAVRTDVLGDTVHSRTAADGSYTLWYLTAGTYSVSVPETPSCYLANPTSRSATVAAGEAATGADFSLDRVAIDSVVVAPLLDTLNALGDTLQLATTAYDTLGSPMAGLTFTWTALDPALVTVDARGEAVGRATGSGRIEVAVCGAADTATVVVRQVPATVTVSPATVTVDPGDTTRLSAAVADSNGVAIGGPVVAWSSADTTVATVDSDGLVTAVASGATTITANSGGVSGEGVVRVRFQSAPGQSTVAAGAFHSCDINAAGEAWCWGNNAYGQLGDGTSAPSANPVKVGGNHTFVTIAAGIRHTCGLSGAGEAYCWGHNNTGQLGNGTIVDSPMPVEVSGGHQFRSIEVGGDATCGVTINDTLYCWGSDAQGEQGNGPGRSDSSVPAEVAGLKVADVDLSDDSGMPNICAVATDGLAYCWGNNSHGKLGDGTVIHRDTPTAVTGDLTFQRISAGSSNTCGMTTAETLACWGDDQNGQLGTTGSAENPNPTAVGGGIKFADFTVGSAWVCGITTDRIAVCWGSNENGELGYGGWDGGTVLRFVAGGHEFVRIDAGIVHNCGKTALGSTYCWGDRGDGALGDGKRGFEVQPVAPPVSFKVAENGLSLSSAHACAVSQAGPTYCWGFNASGQLGDGSREDSATPVTVQSGVSFVSVSTGALHSCGVTATGDAYCWGNANEGALGNGSTGGESGVSTTPVLVEGGHSWKAVGTGMFGNATCGVTTAGAVYCWGPNDALQAGQATGALFTTPQLVDDSRTYVFVENGGNHTCALTDAGEAYCWGSDDRDIGIFGDGTLGTVSASPVAVGGGYAFASLSVGPDFICGVTGDGEAYCWGQGDLGQLGDGGSDNSAVPKRVGTFTLSSITVGSEHACGITTGGNTICWGYDSWGNLGRGFTGGDINPAFVTGGIAFQVVKAGYRTTCGVGTDGTLYCWGGKNRWGMHGDGATDSSNVPVSVSSH